MIYYLLISVALTTTNAEKYFEIEDIPIEHFEHDDVQNDAIDVELMPRSPRSFSSPSVDSDLEPSNSNLEFSLANLPESESFFRRHFGNSENHRGFRSKRYASEEASSAAKDPLKLVSELGEPLELSVIEPEKIDDLEVLEDKNSTTVFEKNKDDLLINDFIRFRRSAKQNSDGNSASESAISSEGINRSIKEQKSSQLQNPLKQFSHVDQSVVTPQAQKDISRGTRGITKEQWVRHAYPVRGDELSYSDNLQEPAENIEAPRVHFVTEGLSGVLQSDRRYDREARARSLNKEISRNLAGDLTPEMDYNQPRYTRNYSPWAPSSRDNRYYQDPRDLRDPYPYRRAYDSYSPAPTRQRRIIYYATLPELPRSPPQANYRGRYEDYGGRYDDYDYRDRYYGNRRYSPEPYRPRKEFYKRPSYEDSKQATKSDYPVKIATDLNVRDVKKNPDRIYSDVSRGKYGADDMY